MHIFVFKTLKILVKNENTTFLKNGINHANIANEKIHLAHCVKSAVFEFWWECGKIRTRKTEYGHFSRNNGLHYIHCQELLPVSEINF